MVRIRKNKILEKNRQGQRGLTCGLVFPSAEIVEFIGMTGGFDGISLDGEHGLFSPESIDAMCRAADGYGLTVTARVPNIDSSTINRYLDRGVMGILGPHIDTADEARALVDACRFAPEGKRSWGGGRGTFYNHGGLIGLPGTERTEFMALTNKEMLVMAQLETVTAFENLDEILEVEGIDAFAYGPNDLAQSMGYPGQPDHPAAVEARQKVAERIHAAGRKLSSELSTGLGMHQAIIDLALGFLDDNQ
jgi:2-keto-3-deoxy-L-rhamnonate aldolase RhmA